MQRTQGSPAQRGEGLGKQTGKFSGEKKLKKKQNPVANFSNLWDTKKKCQETIISSEINEMPFLSTRFIHTKCQEEC